MCNHTSNRENGRQWTKNSKPISSTGEGLKHEHVYRPAYILKHGTRFMLQPSRNTWRTLRRLSDQPLHQDSVCNGNYKYTQLRAPSRPPVPVKGQGGSGISLPLAVIVATSANYLGVHSIIANRLCYQMWTKQAERIPIGYNAGMTQKSDTRSVPFL